MVLWPYPRSSVGRGVGLNPAATSRKRYVHHQTVSLTTLVRSAELFGRMGGTGLLNPHTASQESSGRSRHRALGRAWPGRPPARLRRGTGAAVSRRR